MLALPHPIMAKVPVAAPCFRSSQSPHDDGTTQPDTSLPQICRSYQRPFWKLCKLGSTETHRGRPVPSPSHVRFVLAGGLRLFYMARRLATLVRLVQRPVSSFARATSIETSPWHPSRRTIPQRRPNPSTNSRSTVALPLA